MGESLYRRNEIGNFKSTVESRSGMLKSAQTISGKSIQDRNPAWVTITGTCLACSGGGSKTIPEQNDTWEAQYNAGSIKPRPILENVSLTYGGDWGLSQKISATIKCYDRNSFEQIQKYFLLPGNRISLRFGYSTSKQWHSYGQTSGQGTDQSESVIEGFKVATFSFSAGDDGTWVGKFTAVSASEAIKSVDMMQGLESTGLKYSVGGEIDSEVTNDAYSIPELIASDAQRNGEESMDRVNEGNMGYVIGSFTNYTPTDPDNMKACMVLYTSDHTRRLGRVGDWAAWISRYASRWNESWDESIHGIHEIYVTLGYVVDRIFNGQLKKASEKPVKNDKDAITYNNMKMKFHEDFSQSKLPPNCESGDPRSVLILGNGVAKFNDDNGNSMNFSSLNGFEGANASDVTAFSVGRTVRLDKILIHRNVVNGALNEALHETPNESESVNPKDTKDTLINVNDFFKQIFEVVKECTGGAIQMRLVFDPTETKRETIYIVDQNYGGDSEINCFVFDPINGDGNTRSCNVASNGGSNEMRTSMFLANSKKGDVAAKLRDCDDELEDGRGDKLTDAQEQIWKLKHDPGMMIKSAFDGKQISAFKSCMVDVYRYAQKTHNQYESINWPGMSIDITINGAWGIIPGCAVSTTQLADNWRNKNIYFMVTEVTHDFNQSDWETNIKGIMSFYDKLKYVNL